MRRLTFPGFLARYVASLSESNTTAIYPLVREASSTNPRLKEPLLVYAMAAGKTDTLLMASRKTSLFTEYQRMCNQFQHENLLVALEEQSPEISEEYRKILRSYQSAAGAFDRDQRVKGLMRDRVVKLQAEKHLSTYRICKDMNLNNSNINAWLKNGDNKVGMDTARAVLHYAETATSI